MNPAEIMEALAEQISDEMGTAVPNLQVTDYMNPNPTPPSIDVYPAEEFAEGLRFGRPPESMRFVVRARITTAAQKEGQQLLLSFMDSTSPESLGRAILSDRTLGNKVGGLALESISGFNAFGDIGGSNAFVGATWTVRVVP